MLLKKVVRLEEAQRRDCCGNAKEKWGELHFKSPVWRSQGYQK